MKNYLTAVKNGLQAFWHAWHGHPLVNARETHQAAIRAMYRVNAELTYHDQLRDYFDHEARSMDPHTDWHLFAQLKDQWQTHINERELENRRFQRASAVMDASAIRLRKLENLP